ncbi:MAG TPA: hypothetical protein VJH04_02345 [archaeon]|nr:hypothetical protein [archaeon]
MINIPGKSYRLDMSTTEASGMFGENTVVVGFAVDGSVPFALMRGPYSGMGEVYMTITSDCLAYKQKILEAIGKRIDRTPAIVED